MVTKGKYLAIEAAILVLVIVFNELRHYFV